MTTFKVPDDKNIHLGIGRVVRDNLFFRIADFDVELMAGEKEDGYERDGDGDILLLNSTRYGYDILLHLIIRSRQLLNSLDFSCYLFYFFPLGLRNV